MTIVIKDPLHYPSGDQSVLYFSHLVGKSLDPEVILVCLLLVQGYERKEEGTCFAMVLVVREEV
jgi:hypothetical protein